MPLKRTPLHEINIKHGCRLVSFAGWEMPIQFSGLVDEHHAVRKKAGLFDISHMGVFRLAGSNTKDALQSLVPSDLFRIGPGEACYTLLLNENGGIIDDLIIYDLGINERKEENLILVLNAGRTFDDLNWLKQHLEPKHIKISDEKKDGVLLALQGPEAIKILEHFCADSLVNIPSFGHRQVQIEKIGLDTPTSAFIARTGYTGEDGFELLLPPNPGQMLWAKLIKTGVTPCGLGARDTLRLEASMHLYGNDMNTETTPFEAGLGWLVHLEMASQFIGRNRLEHQAKAGVSKRLVCLELESRAIARKGYEIHHQDECVGEITSGTWSPTLEKAIALAYVPVDLSQLNRTLYVEIRGKKQPAKVVKKPFYRKA